MFKKNRKQSGFTLIELLVIISIIGLISSIIFTSMSSARAKGRDAKRMQDIRLINSAIELYVDANGHAPYAGAANCSASGSPSGNCRSISPGMTEWDALATELSTYLSQLPEDPCGENCNISNSVRATYVYMPPAGIASKCESVGGSNCYTSDVDEQFSVYAQLMETNNQNLNMTFNSLPTFGMINNSFGTSY